MNSIFVFPGQGSQYVGMGADLFDKYAYLTEQADEVLGYSLKQLCLEDPDRVLSNTQYTQPALYLVNIMQYLDRLGEGSSKPDFLAGHSLGEYCALYAAGAFDFISGLKMVAKRGELMSKAPKGAMLAVLKIDQQYVREILSNLGYENIDIANINSRYQCILSGVYDELMSNTVQEAFTNAGGTVIPLNVSAAFHSRCMIDVETHYQRYLKTFEFSTLQIPVVSNYLARPYPEDDYLDVLTRQISNPVRWYESISWLNAKGYSDFVEIGPGNVLTKLCSTIVDDPMEIVEPSKKEESKHEILRDTSIQIQPQIVFMFSGQGSQYYQMGRELYDNNALFRKHMDECNSEYQYRFDQSLIDNLYGDKAKSVEFDDITYSHPALFSVGYSLAQLLIDEGVTPTAVLGHSMGEYIAGVISGAMSFNDGLDLVIRQVELLTQYPANGGLLSILESEDLFYRRPDLFSNVELGGVNFSNNFFVSGKRHEIRDIHRQLGKENVTSVILPVKYAFHSSGIEAIKKEYIEYASRVNFNNAKIPIYSSVYASTLKEISELDYAEYLWDVVRNKVNFEKLVSMSLPIADTLYVDLSASSIFTTFFKYGFPNTYSHTFAINPFGKNSVSMDKLRQEIQSKRVVSA